MCLSPLHIRVKTRNPYKGLGLYKSVPCGKCIECINQYVNDYIIRCIYQYRHTIKNGGCCAFITLTYNNENLPKYVHNIHGKYYGYTFPCFRKSDIKRFRNRIGLALRNYFGWTSEECKDIKYIICSEYGKHFTKRSHYHGLLYFPKQISEAMLVNILRYSWTKPLQLGGKRTKDMFSGDIVLDSQKFQQLGYFSAGSGGWFVKHESCVKYVCKYVSKELNGYNDQHDLDDFVNYEDNYDLVRDMLPFHVQSIGLGACMADEITDDEIIKGSVSVPNGKVDDNGIPQANDFRIPNYVLNKALTYTVQIPCETAKDGMFTLPFLFHNDRYWNIFTQKLEFSAKQHAKTLRLLHYGLLFPTAFFHTLGITLEEFSPIAKYISQNPERYHYFTLLRNFSTFGLSPKILSTLSQHQSCDLANLYYYLVRDKEDARKNMLKRVKIVTSKTLKRCAHPYDKFVDLNPKTNFDIEGLFDYFKKGEVFEMSDEMFELYSLYWTDPEAIVPFLNQNQIYSHYDYEIVYKNQTPEVQKELYNIRKNAVAPYNWLHKEDRRHGIACNEVTFADFFPEYEVMYELESMYKQTIKQDNLESAFNDFTKQKHEKEVYNESLYENLIYQTNIYG